MSADAPTPAATLRRLLASSLQWYLALPVLFFVVVAIVGSVYIFQDFQRDSIDEAHRDAQFAAEGAAAELAEGLALLATTVSTVAQTPGVETLVTGPPRDDCTLNFSGPGTEGGSIGVYRRDGVVVCSSYVPSPESEPPALDASWIEEALAGPIQLAPVPDAVTGQPILLTAAPLPTGDGVVAAIVPLASAGRSMSGRYILDSDLEMIFVTPENTIAFRSIRNGSVTGTSIEGSPFAEEGQNSRADLDGTPRFYASAPAGDSGWTVYAGVGESYALAAANQLFRRELAIIVMALIALLATVALIYLRITRPIHRLAASVRTAATRVKQGEEHLGIDVPETRDEIGDLGRAFEEMAEAIRTREREIEELNRTLERRVEERTAELAAANKELESFSYTVSHDLRAPLRAIDGFSHMLEEQHASQLPATGARYLERIRAGTNRMGALIDDLLQFSRISRAQLQKRAVSMDTVVREALEEVQPEPGERRIEWRIHDLGDAQCDPALLRRVVVNLLSNAVKFTRDRNPAVIEVGREQGYPPVYYVRDNGVGFDMQHAESIFGVFQRLHRQEDFEGTGAGLAIVERIVTRHGGRVWAEAAPDRGATLYFTLEAADAVREAGD